MTDTTIPDFTDKALLVYTIGRPGNDSFLMIDADFQVQAGRLFLVGRRPSSSGKQDWSRDRPLAIAWDRVESYYIFDSDTQYAERFKEYWESQSAASRQCNSLLKNLSATFAGSVANGDSQN